MGLDQDVFSVTLDVGKNLAWVSEVQNVDAVLTVHAEVSSILKGNLDEIFNDIEDNTRFTLWK
jgi:hypothetical protein